jgi:hypothetical protein
VWNFTAEPRTINGSVYTPGETSGVASGNSLQVATSGCPFLTFFNPTFAQPHFEFQGDSELHTLSQGDGRFYFGPSGSRFYVSRHDDSGDYIEWEMVVLHC